MTWLWQTYQGACVSAVSAFLIVFAWKLRSHLWRWTTAPLRFTGRRLRAVHGCFWEGATREDRQIVWLALASGIACAVLANTIVLVWLVLYLLSRFDVHRAQRIQRIQDRIHDLQAKQLAASDELHAATVKAYEAWKNYAYQLERSSRHHAGKANRPEEGG